MKTNLVVDGEQRRIESLIEFMILVDYPVNLTIANLKMNDFINQLQSNLLCEHFEVKLADDKMDYHDFDGYMYLYDFPKETVEEKSEVTSFLSPYLDHFRNSLNQVIKEGFSGKIIVNGFHDEVFAYFATKFSGKENNKVVSTGMLAKTLLLKHALRRYFDISLSDINVSVLGSESKNLISWSRAYIGQSPILAYLANPNNMFSTEIFAKAEEIINKSDTPCDEVIQAKAIGVILDAFYMGNSCLASVGHVSQIDGKIAVTSEPIMLNQTGLVPTVELVLSDKEKQAFDDAKQYTNEIIDEILESK